MCVRVCVEVMSFQEHVGMNFNVSFPLLMRRKWKTMRGKFTAVCYMKYQEHSGWPVNLSRFKAALKPVQ